MSDALPPLEPRRRSEGLPPLSERPERSAGLPPLEPPSPASTRELPPLTPPGGSGPPPPPSTPRGRPRRRGLGTAAVVTLAVLAAGAAGGVTVHALDDDAPAPAAIPQATATSTTGTSTNVSPDDLATAVARVAPTVVLVQTDVGSQGSGVIVEPSGLVVTNNHVIKGATQVTLLTQDERRVPATIVSADENQDLAVLRPEGPIGRGAELADASDALKQGDQVFAIGSPFGLQNTVTAGIVSNAARTNPDNGVPMIQIDAPINPGNSGGGLFDLEGRLIGIPTSILGPISGNVGIGFAVPVSRVRTMLDGAP